MGRAAPLFVSGSVSLLVALDLLHLPTGAAPVRLGLVIVVLALGVALTGILDRSGQRPYWQMALAGALVLMPVVALQASASRVPFVAISRGSAGPLLWLTLATLLTLFGLWLFAVHQSDQVPEDASLLFLPAALLVPAILGAPGALGESSALSMLGLSYLMAGVAILLCLLSPSAWRPIGGAVALGAQFLLLWALGRGPVIVSGGGSVVPACAAALLGTTALLVVLAPLGALFSRRFFQTVEDESRGSGAAIAAGRVTRRADRS